MWLSLTVAVLFIIVKAPRGSDAIGTNPAFTVNTATNRVVDSDGRERYFHGLNVVTKGPPYVPISDHFDPKTSFSVEDAKMLQSLGLNVIRLGVMWAGVEPVEGQYNETYLQQLRQVVDIAYSHGIYTVLDMHQDVISEKFCGEGIPLWAVPPNPVATFGFPFPAASSPLQASEVQNNGIPKEGICNKYVPNWALGYIAFTTGITFDNLYANGNGLRDKWAAFWTKVASVFVGYGDAIIGYELINEPWVGDPYSDLTLMLPGVADAINLQPAFDAVGASIRTVDTSHILFIDGVTWDDFGVGFTDVPGGSAFKNRTVLGWHYYEPPQFNVELDFLVREKDVKRLGIAGFITEFALGFTGGGAAADPDIPDNEVARNLTQVFRRRLSKGRPQTTKTYNVLGETLDAPVTFMTYSDYFLTSWIGWEYKPFAFNRTGWGSAVYDPNTGVENKPFVYNLTRTYPMIVAGTTSSFSYNYTTHQALLVYSVSPSVTSRASQIFFNAALHYANGVNIATSPAGVTYTIAGNYINVLHSVNATSGTQITISISPK